MEIYQYWPPVVLKDNGTTYLPPTISQSTKSTVKSANVMLHYSWSQKVLTKSYQ